MHYQEIKRQEFMCHVFHRTQYQGRDDWTAGGKDMQQGRDPLVIA